jgi:acyl-CoA synthetase (AMP-forming)/AMP-acid ligase II
VSGNFGDVFRAHPAGGAALIEFGDGVRGERPLDYGELGRLCDAFARGLGRAGNVSGHRIGILALNRLEYVVTLFGAMRAGVVPVPVNIRQPAATIDFILRDAGVRTCFADAEHRALVPEGVACVSLDDGWDAFLDPGAFTSVAPDARDTALQIYTSGTTGRPKGVLLGHEGQIWNASVLARSRSLDSSSAMLISAPLYHKNALVALKIALTAGGRAILLPRFDARRYIEAIGRHRATSLSGVPTMYQLVLAEHDLLARTDLRSVRSISVGSAPASTALLDQLKRAFPTALVVGNYGLTEGGPVPFGVHPKGLPRPRGSVGYPLDGVECRLAGPASDQGVLHTRNPGVMLGYHNRPEETAARLRDGWLDTQDVMRRDEAGFYYFVGRADDMFKCGGESIFPTAVEALLERHEAVLQAAVVPTEDSLKGHVPVAFVVLQQGAAADEAALKQFALANGPAYAHPRRIAILDRLPLSGTNKIDRAALLAEARTLVAHRQKAEA